MNLVINKQSKLRMQLKLLASIEPTDVNFLTCYLDTSTGKIQAQSKFRQIKKRFRQKLDARQQIDFDHAARMVEDQLANLDSRIKSVTIFCRSILGGQFFLVMPVAIPLGNRFFFQAKPAIQKLRRALEKSQILTAGQAAMKMLQAGSNSHVETRKSLISRDIAIDVDSYSITESSGMATNNLPASALNPPLERLNAHLDLVT